eukprot:TRINITY_DN6824_c0_g5_i1.p1 TRINITY_DN6824_c0_g5~~TRINITY_DN6824_c0_g5_i1.p1  ORF type:complete len:725 (+),score=202.68 TRINITY_DN6824_c0_g5_i1:119-2176(+)
MLGGRRPQARARAARRCGVVVAACGLCVITALQLGSARRIAAAVTEAPSPAASPPFGSLSPLPPDAFDRTDHGEAEHEVDQEMPLRVSAAPGRGEDESPAPAPAAGGFVDFKTSRTDNDAKRSERKAWALHFKYAAEWLRSAAGDVADSPAAAFGVGAVVLATELALLEHCLARRPNLHGPSASGLLVSARKLLIKGSERPALQFSDDQCGGPCCPKGDCLFCSPHCSTLLTNCTVMGDAPAVRSVWRLRAARAEGRASTAAIGDVGVRWEHCGLCGVQWAQEFVAGQVEGARQHGRLLSEPNTAPGGGPLWHAGEADSELEGLSLETGGAIVVLFSDNDVMVWRMLRSLCTRMRAAHPLILLYTSKPPSERTRDSVALAVSGPACGVHRQVWFVRVPRSLWLIDEADGALSEREEWGVSEPGGYRRMCWFWHRTIHWLPALRPLRAVMRLDTDSEIVTAPRKDPIEAVLEANATYGYVAFCFDNTEFTHGLWRHFLSWRSEHAPGRDAQFDDPDTRRCARPKDVAPEDDRALDFCHVPMFYTNFEVLVPSFFRRPEVDTWMNSVASGVRMYRWGDAPLRALTLGLFARADQLIHFTEFSYRHGRWAEQTGMTRATVERGNVLGASWRPDKFPPHGDSFDSYFLGMCLRPPLALQATKRPTTKAPRSESDELDKQMRSFMNRLGR